jgi:hypothetical protein
MEYYRLSYNFAFYAGVLEAYPPLLDKRNLYRYNASIGLNPVRQSKFIKPSAKPR